MTGLAGGIASWPFLAEAAARELSSACCYHALEHIVVLAVVMPEGEFVEIERQVVLGDIVERAHEAALNERPEAINVSGVNFSAHVLACAVPHDLMGQPLIQ